MHLENIEGETDSNIRKGVQQEPLLTLIEVNHSTMHWLHILFGVVNNIYENMIDNIQAACEIYSQEYLRLEKEYNTSVDEDKNAMTMRETYKESKKGRLSELKQVLRRKVIENRESLQAERDNIEQNIENLDKNKKKTAGRVRKVKAALLKEAEKPANNKTQGQVVRAKI